ncbi:MAG: hypothetical protein U1F67_25715 [Rubrivivax sp.]
MLRDELLVGLERVGRRGLLPVAVLGQLREPGLGLHRELAVGVLLQEVLVGLARVGALGGLPVVLDAAAAAQHQDGGGGHGDRQQT